MKLKLTKVILFLLLCVYTSVGLIAQETFIKRYKNSTLSENGIAVCELPNKQIAIVGQQSNGFAWQSPIIIINDSTGKQIHYKMDTACTFCDPSDAVADSSGNIYIVGTFFGKAGIAKYDTLGNNVWRKLYGLDSVESVFRTICLTETGLLAGGDQVIDATGNSTTVDALLISINLDGDTLWRIITDFDNESSFFQCAVVDIVSNSSCMYITGVLVDSISRRGLYACITNEGEIVNSSTINVGVKVGYSISAVDNNTILIGGASSNVNLNPYSFIAILDTLGNVLNVMEDSTMIYNYITKLDYNKSSKTLYALNFDTIYENGLRKDLDKITSYNYPFNNLQEFEWEKTVTGTYNPTSYRDLKLMQDGKLLHTGYASNNCPQCPYLVKADENTCTDIFCDTSFVTTLFLPHEINASLTLYPNPYSNGYLGYNIESTVEIKSLSLQCFGLNGQQIGCAIKENDQKATGEIVFNNNPAKGVYFLQFLINGQYKVYSRVVKIE